MSKEIIYKCPRYEERKRAENELEERNYYDNKLILSPPICFGCTGCLKSRATKNQNFCCCLVIDTEKVRWTDKKTIRLLKTLAKAIRRQKAKDKRKKTSTSTGVDGWQK